MHMIDDKMYHRVIKKAKKLAENGTPHFMVPGELVLTAKSLKEELMVRKIFNMGDA